MNDSQRSAVGSQCLVDELRASNDRFLEKNGSTFRSIRSNTLFV
jgi:hypothetical protein